MARDPYELTSVFGVGFAIADRIALHSGEMPDESRQREGAAIMHALSESERSGSSCTPLPALLREASALLGCSCPKRSCSTIWPGARRVVREQDWIYRAATAELEAELAERVAELIADDPVPRLRRHEPPAQDAELTSEQQTALQCRLRPPAVGDHRRPGNREDGLDQDDRRPGAGAPEPESCWWPRPGRAAVRMAEASGLRAKTVHSALGWIPGEGPTHDEQDPLSCDLLIVDETSMANLELLVTLLRAVGEDTHVVLVGDADQLAPVGAGKPFAELVSSERVPTTRLTHIFRQAADSMIVQGAHAIRRGDAPRFDPSDGMRRDLFLIERSSPGAALQEIVSLVSRRLPGHYGVDPVRDIQVFAPVYRGELGIDSLNRALRSALNPDGQPVRGGRLRIGDKLMMTGRNLHDLGLMNGTVLRLLDEAGSGPDDDEAALILGAEDSVFRLPPEDADRLALAYACSVHRGQGIELPVAIIVAHPGAGAFFLRREMLYTAITRAQIATVIVGSREVVARAARTPDTGRRHGRLAPRLAALAGDAAAGAVA